MAGDFCCLGLPGRTVLLDYHYRAVGVFEQGVEAIAPQPVEQAGVYQGRGES